MATHDQKLESWARQKFPSLSTDANSFRLAVVKPRSGKGRAEIELRYMYMNVAVSKLIESVPNDQLKQAQTRIQQEIAETGEPQMALPGDPIFNDPKDKPIDLHDRSNAPKVIASMADGRDIVRVGEANLLGSPMELLRLAEQLQVAVALAHPEISVKNAPAQEL